MQDFMLVLNFSVCLVQCRRQSKHGGEGHKPKVKALVFAFFVLHVPQEPIFLDDQVLADHIFRLS